MFKLQALLEALKTKKQKEVLSAVDKIEGTRKVARLELEKALADLSARRAGKRNNEHQSV